MLSLSRHLCDFSLGQRIDKQLTGMGVTVSATGGEYADVLLAALALPSDGYRIHVYT
jgi:hypothetical protein